MENINEYLNNISFLTFVFIFAGGVLTSFTPCVFPLIPIVVGVIGGASGTSRWKNFILSLAYVLGMAVTFSVLGMVAALTGKLFGQIQSSPTAHVIVGSFIILFGLALVDVIPMPTFLLSKAGAGRVGKGGSFFSVFLMGAASGFVAAPCTAAVLAAVLTFVASTQNIVLGFSLLFVFALGLGTLLVLVGTFTGVVAALKKSEKWALIIQKVMALFMIALGCYFIFQAGKLSF